MIRYRVAGHLDLADAAQCGPAALRPLRRFGPWRAFHAADGTVVELVGDGWTARDWSAWAESEYYAGLSYAVAEPPPDDLRPWQRPARLEGATVLELMSGYFVAIPPALIGGVVLGRGGRVKGLAGEYARALAAALDAQLQGAEVPIDQWLRVARLAIQAGYRLPDDAVDALGLVTAGDLRAILEAAAAAPKVPCGDEPSSALSPGSIRAASPPRNSPPPPRSSSGG